MIVVMLKIAEFDVRPVAAPGRGEEDLDAGSFGGTEEQEVAVEI